MKRLLTAILLLSTSLSLTACSGNYGKTEKIKDPILLESMNQTIIKATHYYFDTEIPVDKSFEYEAFQSFIPSTQNKKEYIHHSNIFQASTDAKEGEISAYGGVLTPDNQSVTGLILNVFNEKVPPKAYTEDDVKEIAIQFLRDKQLVESEEKVDFVERNDKASSTYVAVLNFDSETKRFAVGVNLQFGTIVYFEYSPLEFFNES